MKTATVLVLLALIVIGNESVSALRSSPGKLQKPGSCPKLTPNAIGNCIDGCSGDDSCPKKLKCCSKGCGHACMLPVFKADDSPVKVGFGSPKYG